VQQIEFDDGKTIDDVATWADYENFFAAFATQTLEGNDEGRVFLGTYNEFIGSIRMEVMRVDGDKCAWKVGAWRNRYRLTLVQERMGEPSSEDDGCYGPLDGNNADQKPFGPQYDDERYTAQWVYEEWRYIIDLSRDPAFAKKRLKEMITSGFVDPVSTRTARIKMLLYNNALPMFCTLSIEGSLSATGVMRPSFNTASFPIQEYMSHNYIFQLGVEFLFLLWTLQQATNEFREIISETREYGFFKGLRFHFFQLFNSLDFFRFVGITLGVVLRVLIITDTSRDLDLRTGAYVDTEYISRLYSYYDIVTAQVTLWSLFSTVQYFELTDRTQVLKGTLAKAGLELLPFSGVFLLFFGVYSLVGSYLLGPSIEQFSTLTFAFATSFDMMNANLPLEDLYPAMPPQDTLRAITVIFYYYTFIALHFFMLLNLVIAMVVDAYIDVQTTNKAVVASTLKTNMGALHYDIYDVMERTFKGLNRRFFRLLRGSTYKEDEFNQWGNDKWMSVLEQVIADRKGRGVPSFSLTLAVLANNIKSVHNKKLAGGDKYGLDPRIDVDMATRKRSVSRSSTTRRMSSSNLRKSNLEEAVTPEKKKNAKEGEVFVGNDYSLKQCVEYLFKRPHFVQPANLEKALSDKDQAVSETWHDMVLQKIAHQVEKLDKRSLTLELAVAALSEHTESMLDVAAGSPVGGLYSYEGAPAHERTVEAHAPSGTDSDGEGLANSSKQKLRRRRSKSRERGDGENTAASEHGGSQRSTVRRQRSIPRGQSRSKSELEQTASEAAPEPPMQGTAGWGRGRSEPHIADV